MRIEEYVIETESFKQVCPNCSRDREDYVQCVDRYGRDSIEGGDGYYCGRCGYCFESI